MADTTYRTALGEVQKLSLRPGKNNDELAAHQAGSYIKVRQGTGFGKFIPGTNQLTVITAINAVT
jgi:hypothetical protein